MVSKNYKIFLYLKVDFMNVVVGKYSPFRGVVKNNTNTWLYLKKFLKFSTNAVCYRIHLTYPLLML